jgi:nucleoredoxin
MASDGLVGLLGDKLVSTGGEQIDTSTLADNDCIGLYFSAHWCPPCRGFTPKLAQGYKKIRGDGKKFEIVFVSSDKDQSSFDEYFGEMPWKALPFADRERKAALSKKFKVNGIPTLVLIKGDGSVITVDGREAVGGDLEGNNFPWVPPTFHEALGDKFLRHDGAGGFSDTTFDEALKGKYIALYFSAHWCPPCRGFTPKLKETYEKMKAKRDDFEFVFVSSDKDESSMKSYMKEAHGAWLTLPFARRDSKEALSTICGVQGIPTFAVIDPDGNIITTKARGNVASDPTGEMFPWHPLPVSNLDTDADGLNDETCVLLLTDASDVDDSDRALAKVALNEVATAHKEAAKAKGEPPSLLFFASTTGQGPVGQIRRLCKTENTGLKLIILDIPDNGGYYTFDAKEAMSSDSLSALITKFQAGAFKGERKQLG